MPNNTDGLGDLAPYGPIQNLEKLYFGAKVEGGNFVSSLTIFLRRGKSGMTEEDGCSINLASWELLCACFVCAMLLQQLGLPVSLLIEAFQVTLDHCK